MSTEPQNYGGQQDDRVTLSIPAAKHRVLKIASAKLGRPMSELISEAIDTQLPKWEQEAECQG